VFISKNIRPCPTPPAPHPTAFRVKLSSPKELCLTSDPSLTSRSALSPLRGFVPGVPGAMALVMLCGARTQCPLGLSLF
jgi:hypothetical protein